MALVHGCHAQDLGSGSDPAAAFLDPMLEHGGHSCPLCCPSDRIGGAARTDQGAHLLACFEYLENACAPAITSSAAVIASARFADHFTFLQAEQAITRVVRNLVRA